jgi:urease beta subunit
MLVRLRPDDVLKSEQHQMNHSPVLDTRSRPVQILSSVHLNDVPLI